jgi:hypothetical protein
MDFNRNSTGASTSAGAITGAYINPYAKRPAAAASDSNNVAIDVAINSVVNDFNMGIRSQLLNGSIHKSKKIATKAKTKRNYKQNAIGSGEAFVEGVHCGVCKAKRDIARGKDVKLPHRSHDKRCSLNRRTRGLSATTVLVNKEAARNMAINTAPIASVLGQKLAAEAGTNIARFFAPYPQLNPPDTNVAQISLGTDDVVVSTNQQGRNLQKFEQKTRSIREVMDDTLGDATGGTNECQEFKWLETTKYPRALTLAIDLIVSKCEHRKSSKTEDPLPRTSTFLEAMEKYHTYFPPGTCTYTFPQDNSTPSLHYHFIAGESFIYLDWKLLVPRVALSCSNCLQSGIPTADCRLIHDRTNFSKSKALFPVWTGSGRPTLAVLMNYKCEACSSMFLANDCRILMQLDAHIRDAYPVDPKYAQGTFHMDIDLTDDLELLMTTYANGSYVGKKMNRKLGLKYTRKVETYLSQFPNNEATSPVSFEEFSRGFSPPSAAAIRTLYKAGTRL